MLHTLRSKLLLFFLALSLGSILLVSLAIQFGFEDSFQRYLQQERTDQMEQIISELKEEYRQTGRMEGDTMGLLLHHQAMSESLFYQFYDRQQNLVFDTTFMGRMGHRSEMKQPFNEQEMLSASFAVEVEGEQLGTLTAFYPKEYVQGEFQFLSQFNKYILIAAVSMTILSVICSIWFSKRLTSGLHQLKRAARELQSHNLQIRIPAQNLDQEVADLAVAFNDLAETLHHEGLLRKQYIGDLAHELRTPLATLRSQVEAFQDGIWQPTPERLKQSHHELMRLVRLVSEFEKLAAAENPQIQLHIQQMEAGSLLNSLIEPFRLAIEEKGLALRLQLPDTELWFKADPDRVRQIFTNLIENALKYTPSGGEVFLEAKKGPNAIHFSVADTGIGISQQDLPHIFERFYRGEKSRDRKTGGVGIGLSIVKALVQAHKGEIQVESEPQKGTKITVTLPLENQEG